MKRIKLKTKDDCVKTISIIKKNVEKGKGYLLWEMKKMSKKTNDNILFFSIVKSITDEGEINIVDYALNEEEKSSDIIENHDNINIISINHNAYDIYLITKEEAKPYLKKAIVLSLTNEVKHITI